MAFTQYHTLNGQIEAETRPGGVRVGYALDAPGSVTSLTNTAGAATSQHRYEAYGARHQASGSSVNPRFGWCGSWGYRADLVAVSTYIRARHYDRRLCFWTTRDQLWPREYATVYVRSNPASLQDPSGKASPRKCCCTVNSFQAWQTPVYNYPTFVGHAIALEIHISRVIDEGGPCTLNTYEKTNTPFTIFGIQYAPKDKWYRTQDYPEMIQTPFVQPTGCPSKSPTIYRDVDTPGLPNINATDNLKGKLCQRVELRDGCTGEVWVKTFFQYLEISGGKVLQLRPPGADLGDYCDWSPGVI